MILPPEAHPLAQAFAFHFTSPTYQRFSTLLVGAVLTTGRRTVADVLRTLRHRAPGHPAAYRRVLSRAPWSGVTLGCALARLLLDHVVPDGPVALVGDDTVDGHPGRAVYGKGRHRDAVRSSHAYAAWRYGHKWVALAVLVRLPFAARRWALPVLIDLYRTPEVSKAEGARRHTPARLMCRLLRLVLIRSPGRAFVFAGDSGFGTHEAARFCCRHRRRLTLVGKLHPDVDLFELPPPYLDTARVDLDRLHDLKPGVVEADVETTPAAEETEGPGWGGGRYFPPTRRIHRASPAPARCRSARGCLVRPRLQEGLGRVTAECRVAEGLWHSLSRS